LKLSFESLEPSIVAAEAKAAQHKKTKNLILWKMSKAKKN